MEDGEAERLGSLPGVRSIKSLGVVTTDGAVASASYLVTLDLSDDQDAVVTTLLRNVLDMGITPRKFTQSRSLEKHFLEVTGSPGTH